MACCAKDVEANNNIAANKIFFIMVYIYINFAPFVGVTL
jgi:hypothetical protein